MIYGGWMGRGGDELGSLIIWRFSDFTFNARFANRVKMVFILFLLFSFSFLYFVFLFIFLFVFFFSSDTFRYNPSSVCIIFNEISSDIYWNVWTINFINSFFVFLFLYSLFVCLIFTCSIILYMNVFYIRTYIQWWIILTCRYLIAKNDIFFICIR